MRNERPCGQRAVAGLVAVGSLAALLGCGTSGPDSVGGRDQRGGSRTGDVVVAVAWPWAAHHDARFGDGIDLAVSEINAAGGIGGRRLRIERFDDHESVDEGRLVAQRIVSDRDVVAVIGHLQSYVTLPAAAIYDLAGLVLISPTATDPALTQQGYHRVFRTTFSDQAVGEQLADFAVEHSYRRVAISYIRDTYGRGLANAFEERLTARGDTVVARDSYDPSGDVTAQMVGPMMRDWTTLTPDAVFLAGEVPSAATIVAEARREGIRAPILGGDAMSSPALLQVAGPAAEGVIVAAAFHPAESNPEVQRFVTAFAQRFGASPDVGAALGYDAVSVLATAMKRAHTAAPAAVAAALHALTDWHGVTGPFAFDSAGNRVRTPIVTVVVRHGQFALLADTTTRIATR